jgi:diguanylate cyclase (GGDEF)-like protein
VNALIAIAAVLGALVVLLAALLRHAGRRGVVERRRERLAGDISGSVVLEEVLDRLLEAAAALTGADAAAARLHAQAVEGDGDPVTRVRGPAPSDGEGGVGVALTGEEGALGSLRVYGPRLGRDAVRRLEELAQRAAPAIENARRFREARRLADVDALTGLHNRRYFHETLVREVARAHRYSRKLALIVLDVDDFKHVNDRVGHLAGDAVLAEVAERVRSVLRRSDVPCRVGGDEFAVIMPESTLDQADQLFVRLQAVISSEPIPQVGTLRISAGLAELRPDDDSVSLFTRADSGLYRAKGSGKGQAVEAT